MLLTDLPDAPPTPTTVTALLHEVTDPAVIVNPPWDPERTRRTRRPR